VKVTLDLGDGAAVTAPTVFAEFGPDRHRAAMLADAEAWDYAQQRGCQSDCREAAKAARNRDPQRATELLARAQAYARQAGNTRLSQTVERASEELRRSQTISSATVKWVLSDARTKTVRSRHARRGHEQAMDEAIRKATGGKPRRGAE
jgi:hypothetical protein